MHASAQQYSILNSTQYSRTGASSRNSSTPVVFSRVRRRLDVEVPPCPQLDARADVHRDELLEKELARVRDLQVRELVRALQPLADLAAAGAADQAARAANRRGKGIRAHLMVFKC